MSVDVNVLVVGGGDGDGEYWEKGDIACCFPLSTAP